jgi:hypothetical protein
VWCKHTGFVISSRSSRSFNGFSSVHAFTYYISLYECHAIWWQLFHSSGERKGPNVELPVWMEGNKTYMKMGAQSGTMWAWMFKGKRHPSQEKGDWNWQRGTLGEHGSWKNWQIDLKWRDKERQWGWEKCYWMGNSSMLSVCNKRKQLGHQSPNALYTTWSLCDFFFWQFNLLWHMQKNSYCWNFLYPIGLSHMYRQISNCSS